MPAPDEGTGIPDGEAPAGTASDDRRQHLGRARGRQALRGDLGAVAVAGRTRPAAWAVGEVSGVRNGWSSPTQVVPSAGSAR